MISIYLVRLFLVAVSFWWVVIVWSKLIFFLINSNVIPFFIRSWLLIIRQDTDFIFYTVFLFEKLLSVYNLNFRSWIFWIRLDHQLSLWPMRVRKLLLGRCYPFLIIVADSSDLDILVAIHIFPFRGLRHSYFVFFFKFHIDRSIGRSIAFQLTNLVLKLLNIMALLFRV